MTDKKVFEKLVSKITCACGWTGQYWESLVNCFNKETANFEDVCQCPKCKKTIEKKGGEQ